MEEVAVSPMVAADNNGAAAVPDIVIPSVISVEETDLIIGHLATIAVDNDDDELNAESTKDGDHIGTRSPVCRSPSSTRKKRGAFSLFRAMFVSFGRSDSMKKADYDYDTTSPKKKKQAIAAADDGRAAGDSPSWTSLVDGVRPLRLRGQELEYYPPPPPLGHADVYHDVLLPPPSPARSAGLEEAVGMTSRYASAQDLHQMDGSGEEEEDAPAADGGHAIDMQAEEFIAKFYEQFKSESFDGRANE